MVMGFAPLKDRSEPPGMEGGLQRNCSAPDPSRPRTVPSWRVVAAAWRGRAPNGQGRLTGTANVCLVDAPSHKDVITAIVGASAALAGLTLVFLGLVVSAYQSLPGDVVTSVRRNLKSIAWPIFIVFTVGAVAIALGIVWLAVAGGTLVYAIALGLFGVELAGMVGVALMTIRRLLS